MARGHFQFSWLRRTVWRTRVILGQLQTLIKLSHWEAQTAVAHRFTEEESFLIECRVRGPRDQLGK